MKEILFNAKTFEVNASIIENIKNRLLESYQGAVTLEEIKLLKFENQLAIKIRRECKNFSCPEEENLISLLDAAILCNLPFDITKFESRPAVPFNDVLVFFLEIPEVVAEYNKAVRNRSKIKDLLVYSTAESVTYVYQF